MTQLSIEPLELMNNPNFNSKSLIPWKEIKEGSLLHHEGIVYEVAFKSIRKRSVDGFLLESKKILYLRSLPYVENVIAEIDEDDHFSLMWNTRMGESSWRGEPPSTGIGYESWTEEYLDSLKAELKRKTDKIRSLLK